MYNGILHKFSKQGANKLAEDDPFLYSLLTKEYVRQNHTLAMVAASSAADPSVISCEGTVLSNVTAEGYPGKRYHAGCDVADEIENLAIARAKKAFKAQYANVQPHSGSSANEILLFSLLNPGDRILGLDLNAGGHLTHGSNASVTGKYFEVESYGLDNNGYIDYDDVAQKADTFKPKIIICGASAYSRTVDFKKFRKIADKVNSLLLADISHIAGLVVAGLHVSPIDYAHFTTTSTYKQLYGPRGGLILIGKDYNSLAPDGKHTLEEVVQRAVFPSFQGTPMLNNIAAKARALDIVTTPAFNNLAIRIIEIAKIIADEFIKLGYRVITGGTDNHIVLIDIYEKGITGVIAEKAMEECKIIINKNRIHGDTKSALVTSGIRIGSNSLALRGISDDKIKYCVKLVDEIIQGIEVINDCAYLLDTKLRERISQQVEDLCISYPIPGYCGI